MLLRSDNSIFGKKYGFSAIMKCRRRRPTSQPASLSAALSVKLRISLRWRAVRLDRLARQLTVSLSKYLMFDFSMENLKVRLKTSSRIAELSQHEADGGELQEGEAAAVEIFPVLGETAAAIEPSNRAFYDPTLG